MLFRLILGTDLFVEENVKDNCYLHYKVMLSDVLICVFVCLCLSVESFLFIFG